MGWSIGLEVNDPQNCHHSAETLVNLVALTMKLHYLLHSEQLRCWQGMLAVNLTELKEYLVNDEDAKETWPMIMESIRYFPDD